jgi:hypothetical protein
VTGDGVLDGPRLLGRTPVRLMVKMKSSIFDDTGHKSEVKPLVMGETDRCVVKSLEPACH